VSGNSLTEISEIMLFNPDSVSVDWASMREKRGFNNNAEAVSYLIAPDLAGVNK